MKKYTTDKKEPLSNPIPIRFEQRAIDEAAEINNNFAESVRDALDDWIIKNKEFVK